MRPGTPSRDAAWPGQAPGLDAAQSGYRAHPGVQQPYNHQSGYGPSPQSGYDPSPQSGYGQPGQQPHNPDGQH